MLWSSIYDFFVRYVFGGSLESGFFEGIIGRVYNATTGTYTPLYTTTFNAFEIRQASGSTLYMSLGNYLSLIATIISITIIVVLCCLFVYKIIKTIGGLIR